MTTRAEHGLPDTPPTRPTARPPTRPKTLRDEFAMAALQGFLANGSQRLIAAEIENSPQGRQVADTEAMRKIVNYQIARGVYLLADAMIEARK